MSKDKGAAGNTPACFKAFMDADEGTGVARQRWAGAATFVLAAIGSAIGLGNFWRFPYLCFKWGGGAFFIPYLIALFICGLPMMLLELSLGQLFQRGDIGVFQGIHRRLYGVGLASVFSAFAINIFYTYLIAIACCYMMISIFNPSLPWSMQRTKAYQEVYCKATDQLWPDGTPVMKSLVGDWNCPKQQECDPSDMYITEEYFMKDLLTTWYYKKQPEGSDIPDCTKFDTSVYIAGDPAYGQKTRFSWPVCLGLLMTWFVTYFCVFKGVKSSSFVVWFTVPGPVVFIFIMVLRGLTLPNADEGIRMYLRGEIDGKIKPTGEVLSQGQMWADALGQIFFSLGVCMGVMTSYASYNRRNKPIIRDVMAISFGNCMLSFFAGFAVFSIVGYLNWIGSPVASKNSSSALAFVAYPAAAETMKNTNFWTFLLGITLFTLGIDTAFSLVEAISTVIYDTNWGSEVPRKLTALLVCVLGFGFSLLFCASWGFTYFDVIDRYISVYLMFILGIGQCFSAAWMFGRQELTEGEDQTSISVLSIVYWINLLVMGPVTVFCFTGTEKGGASPLWGLLIFWIITFVAIFLSFVLKKSDKCGDWYKNVFLYGAYNLADEVVKREDETLQGNQAWYGGIFVLWWGFSIKYLMPWALWQLMMWNFSIDLGSIADNGRGYSNYNVFWQVMGFLIPVAGLLCFFIPMCAPPEPQKRTRNLLTDFIKETDSAYEAEEEAYRAGLIAARKQMEDALANA